MFFFAIFFIPFVVMFPGADTWPAFHLNQSVKWAESHKSSQKNDCWQLWPSMRCGRLWHWCGNFTSWDLPNAGFVTSVNWISIAALTGCLECGGGNWPNTKVKEFQKQWKLKDKIIVSFTASIVWRLFVMWWWRNRNGASDPSIKWPIQLFNF